MNSPIDQFCAWLSQRIKELEPGQRLPSDRALAKQWGIADKTVARIIKPFCDSNALCRIPGKGTFVPSSDSPESQAVIAQRASWEEIAEKIFEMIRAGRLKQGEVLPQIKLISLQYHVTPATVIRAYKSLCSRGVAEKVGRGYFVGKFEHTINRARPSKQVLFYLFGGGNFKSVLQGHGLALAFSKCEYELVKNGFRVEYHYEDHFRKQYPKWKKGQKLPYGIVAIAIDPSQYDTYLPRFQTLTRFESVIRPNILCISRASKRPPPGINLFCTGNVFSSWGRTVAEFIVGKGIGEAAFYIDTAMPGRSFIAHVRILLILRILDPHFRFRFIVRCKGGAKNKNAFFKSIRNSYSPEHLRYIFAKYHNLSFDDVADRTETLNDFSAAFKKYFSSGLWLFAQDSHAVDALSWCEKNKVAVPEKLSIIGLENNPDFAHHGLTTCAEDWDSMGYLMAHAVINDFAVAKTRRGFLRTSAFMLERSTTPY
jgi:DNA-binding GntR family transcriptional regulator